MIERIFGELGPWNWMVLGFVLLVFEILLPGVFLLWIGIAALVIGAISLALWDAGFWIWQVRSFDDAAFSIEDADGRPFPAADLPFSRVMATGRAACRTSIGELKRKLRWMRPAGRPWIP